MARLKRILVCVLTIAMMVSLVHVSETKTVYANQYFLIKAADSDTYLYANGNVVSTGNLNNESNAYHWRFESKSDGSYWIKNQATGSYMCIENQKGVVELFDTVYEVWQSCKWKLSIGDSTTIQSSWLGNDANISISGISAVYGTDAQRFSIVAVSGGEQNPTEGEDDKPYKSGEYADSLEIPEKNDDINSIGATMPYYRYDSEQASLGGGAVIAESKNFAKENIASQASGQSYVRLPKAGAYAEWTMSTTGNGVTMRFTMPDSSDGMGLNGSVDVYVNGIKEKTVDLTSYYMWQYFQYPNPYTNGHPDDKLIKAGSTGCFAFDEVHFRLDKSLQKGDKIRIQSSGAGNLEYGVDFLEIEETGAPIVKPENAYSITDYGAKPNDGINDMPAIRKCIDAAKRDGKDVYFPEGTFEISQMWRLDASNMKITGAGMWYTNVKFTSSEKSGGGISGAKASNVEFCNMYLNSGLRSRYNQEAVYKCFMDVWSKGSYIHDIWEEHFECGFWLADYYFADGTDYADGIKIYNSRIRNNFADGVNFCQGTSNATVYNCSIRNNGDDGLAMWNNDWNVKDEEKNVFCYNTIDFIWRAGAIAIYGGNGHKVYNNYIEDSFMASGIHLNTAFDGYKFKNNNRGIKFDNNIIVRSGTSSDSWQSDMAALDISGDVENVTFTNTYIYNSQHDAVRIINNPSDIIFNNLKVYKTGVDNRKISDNNGALLKFSSKNASPFLKINGLEYSDISYSDIVYGNRSNCNITDEKNLGNNFTYVIPAGTKFVANPPTPETSKPAEENTKSGDQNAGTTKSDTDNNSQATGTENGKDNNQTDNSNGISSTDNSGEHVQQDLNKKITVAKTKIKTAKRSKGNRTINASLKKVKGASGYQWKYSTTKKFSKKKTGTVYTRKTKMVFKKLKKGSVYYLKVRAYKVVDGRKYYGVWSAKKRVKRYGQKKRVNRLRHYLT